LDSKMQTSKEHFVDFVYHYLIVRDARCYRHCQNQAQFVSLESKADGIVGGYICPGNYASRVVYFSLHPDREWFEGFLKDQAGNLVKSKDIRSATRHGWELGGLAESEILKVSDNGVRQFYWTLYPATEEEKTKGAFRCGKCGRLYVKQFSNDSKVCPDCAKTGSGL